MSAHHALTASTCRRLAPLTFGLVLFTASVAHANPTVILNPRGYTLSQPGVSAVTIPAVETLESAAAFYDYYSASSHTGYEKAGRSLMFLHRDVSQNPPPLSLIITHGIDELPNVVKQKSATVNMDLTGLPSTTSISQSDDPGEFTKANPTTAQGRWVFNNNTDGGVVTGFPETSDWSVDMTIASTGDINQWQYFFANGQNVSLDMSKPVTISYDAPPTNATYSVEGYEGVPVTICATVVSSNNSTSTYTWEWEDQPTPATHNGATSTSVETICDTYTFDEDGVYEVELSVTDGTGTSTVTTRVLIHNTDPGGDNVAPLHDEFDGEWKSCLWDSYQRYGSGTYREGDAQYDPNLNTVRNNRLDLKVPANYLAGMDWETGLESTYMLGGNFDVQVDFHLPDAEYWTNLDMRGLNVLFVELMANDAGSRRRQVRNSRLNPNASKAVFNPHLWVANHESDLVTQIDTDNPGTDYGQRDLGILGQYPVGDNPSRTSVDLQGNVWINHRADSTVWRIRASECSPPACSVATVNASYKDRYTPPYSNGQTNGGGVAVDKDNNPWVGFLNDRKVVKLDQSTGQVINVTSVPGRVYGLAVDANDYIWVDEHWDGVISKIDALTGVKIDDYKPSDQGDSGCFAPYGITVDSYGKVWTSNWGHCPYLMRFDPKTETFERFTSPNGSNDLDHNRGVASDNQGLIWTVSSEKDKLSVFNMETGAYIASYSTCDAPSGVALDRNNRIWVTCINGHVWNFDRNGTVLHKIDTGSNTYSYSDMTGYQLRNFGSNAWKENFTSSQSITEDNYFISSVENNYGGGIEEGVGGDESFDPSQAPVSDLFASSASLYELTRLSVGDLTYTDRLFRIISHPSEVEGLWALRTPNEDRGQQLNPMVTMTAKQELDLYLAYDAKSRVIPAWIQDFYTAVDEDGDGQQDSVATTNGLTPDYKLFKRRYASGASISLGGNLASAANGASTYRSCAEIKQRDPLAPTGTYMINTGVGAARSVLCDMDSDGGVGHTMLKVSAPNTTNQNDYVNACRNIGMDVIVPRSKGHAEAIVRLIGHAPNLVNVKAADVNGNTKSAKGFAGYTGHCRDESNALRDCSFYLAETNDGDCGANSLSPTYPQNIGGNNGLLARTANASTNGCTLGKWQFNSSVYQQGWVICSTNDAVLPEPASCDEIAFNRSQHNTTQGISGAYWLTSSAGVRYQTTCDMHYSGGGWTQGIRVNGRDTAFNYDAALWTNGTVVNDLEPQLNGKSAKFYSFLSVPFDQLLVGMATIYAPNSTTLVPREFYNYLTVDKSASSMLAMFQGGNNQPINASTASGLTGRAAWKSLLANSSLQANCNQQAINNNLPNTRARIGILSNQENDCNTPDSRIGIGGRGSACGQNNDNTAGNTATCTPDNGVQDIAASGVIYGRRRFGSLVARYDFDNSTTQDSSGKNNHAFGYSGGVGACTNTAGPAFATGKSTLGTSVDRAIGFDGCDDYLRVADNASLNSSSLSLSFWIRLDSARWAALTAGSANNWISLIHKGSTAGTTTGFDVVIEEDGRIAFDTGHGASHRWWPTRVQLTGDAWTHVALSYDAATSTKSIWINGELKDSRQTGMGPIVGNTTPLYISNNSGSSPSSASSLPGLIDELRIYDGPIPEATVKQLSGTSRGSDLSNYFAYFRPTAFSQPPPSTSAYTIIEDPVRDANDNTKDPLSVDGRLRIVRTANIWSFFYADEVTNPTVWKRMGDPMDLGTQDVRMRLRTRLDPFWHSGPVNNPGGAISIQYDNYRVNSADQAIGVPVEICDGIDNDCDGQIDENFTGKYDACTVPGAQGVCAEGYLVCEAGGLVCKPINMPSPEVCDDLDNDCNGEVDDYVDGGETVDGTYVSTGDSCTDQGALGPCRAGQFVCEMGVMICKGAVPREPEICDGIDNDCDGNVDNTTDHVFASLGHFLNAKQRTLPFVWPRPVVGTRPFFSDDADPTNDFVAFDGVSSNKSVKTVYLSTVSDVHALRKARVLFYLDATLADAQNPQGRYVLWLTQGRAEGGQGAANAAYGVRHTLAASLSLLLNDNNESSLSAGSTNKYQNFVVTSEAGSTGGVAIGPLPASQPWTLDLSATFDGDIDAWELYNPETGAHLELNPSQLLTLENKPLPNNVLLTADAGMSCGVVGAKGVCSVGTGYCAPGGVFGCNQTVTPLPHELCDSLDNDCDGDTDEGDVVFAKVEVRQDAHPTLSTWLWAPTIDNGLSAEESLHFMPEGADDRIGSPEMPSVEDMLVSLQKLDSSVTTFHLDQRAGLGTLSMPLLHGKRTEGPTGSIPAQTTLKLDIDRIAATLPRELFTSLYDDRTGAEADAAPRNYTGTKFEMEWTLRRKATSNGQYMREADGIVVRDLAESYTSTGSNFKLAFRDLGNLKAWELYRPYRPVLTLDKSRALEVRTSMVSGLDAACVIQDHPVDECLGEVSRYICVNGQVTCKINPAGCCKDRDGDGFYGYDALTCDTGTDCDDTNADIHPGATEVCDAVDNDCDGLTAGGGTCSWLDPGCNHIDETYPEQGSTCEGPLDADCKEAPGEGGYDCVRDGDGNCVLDGNGKCELFRLTATGECDTRLVCIDGGLVCTSVIDPALEVCDGLDNDCDGEIDRSDLTGQSGVPDECRKGELCGPRECEYRDVCVCISGKVGTEACDCREGLSPGQGNYTALNPCRGNTLFDGERCIPICAGDNDCEAGYVCDPESRDCVLPAAPTAAPGASSPAVAGATPGATSPGGCATSGSQRSPAPLALGALLLLGAFGIRRRKKRA